MVKRVVLATGVTIATVVAVLLGSVTMAAGSANEGVTSKTIRIGVPFINFASLASVGVKLNQGNVTDAYSALIANMNKNGGVVGRKIVAYYEPVDLLNGTVGVDTVCTSLTEDDTIFLAMAPYQPNCYVVTHATPTINGLFEGAAPTSGAPNFTLTPPANAYDPLQLSVFTKLGIFRGKKVGLYGQQPDATQIAADATTLKKLHVSVVQTAVNSAPAGDTTDEISQDGTIVQRFQSAGVNEVVAVGSGSAGWPNGLAQLQSRYNPSWIALNYSSLQGTLATAAGEAPYLKTATTSSPTPTATQSYKDPAVQQCVAIIKKAYPSDTITSPSQATGPNDQTYTAPLSACQSLALFAAIAKAAGKNLTVATFARAGYGLRNVTLPGVGGPVSFGPGRDYAIGPVFIGKYSAAANQFVFSAKSVS